MSARLGGVRGTAVAFLVIYALARVVAFGRETTIAYLFGATRNTDAYVAATALPELVAGILLSGVLGYAIIPEFLRRRANDDHPGANRLIRAAYWQVVIATGLLVVVTIAFAGPLTSAFAPGLHRGAHHDAVRMLRIASPAMVLYGMTGVAGAVLNTRRSFLPVPLSFVIGNAFGIVVLVVLAGIGIDAAAIGYVASAAAFAAVQWALVRRTSPVRVGGPIWRGPEVSVVVRAGFVAIVVTSAPFIRSFFERILASTAAAGDLAALGFATRLVLAVGSIVAVSIGTVVFPTMAEQVIATRQPEFLRTLTRAVTLVVAISLPISIVMMAAPRPIVRLLFEHGRFNAHNAAVTSSILRAFAVSIVAVCINEVLLRALFAIRAHRRALVAILANLCLNLVLDIWLLHAIGVAGLGVGASIALWLNVCLLSVVLTRSFGAQSRLSGVA